MSGDEDLFVDAYGVDASAQVMGQVSAQLSTARTQRQNALNALNQAISQLQGVDAQIKNAIGMNKPWDGSTGKHGNPTIDSIKRMGMIHQLKGASELALANKTRARRKIEGLINPEKAKEAKRLRFAFPAVIGLVSAIGGSKFWKLNGAIKDSFDLCCNEDFKECS